VEDADMRPEVADEAIDPIPTDRTVRLVLTAFALVIVLAAFLMFCIQAGRNGTGSTLRYWKATMFSTPYRSGGFSRPSGQSQPSSPGLPPQTGRASAASVRPRAANGVPPSGSEAAKVAAALRASLRDYKPDAKRTSTVTLSTSGSIQAQSAGPSTTLDGIPMTQQAGDDKAR
jgi:hypothetical protein